MSLKIIVLTSTNLDVTKTKEIRTTDRIKQTLLNFILTEGGGVEFENESTFAKFVDQDMLKKEKTFCVFPYSYRTIAFTGLV